MNKEGGRLTSRFRGKFFFNPLHTCNPFLLDLSGAWGRKLHPSFSYTLFLRLSLTSHSSDIPFHFGSSTLIFWKGVSFFTNTEMYDTRVPLPSPARCPSDCALPSWSSSSLPALTSFNVAEWRKWMAITFFFSYLYSDLFPSSLPFYVLWASQA